MWNSENLCIVSVCWRPHTRVFALKTHLMFPSRRTKLKIQEYRIRSFWICLWGKLRQGHHMITVESSFPKCFPFTLIREDGFFQLLLFEERFLHALFSWQISVDGRANQRSKDAFSNFSVVVWTRPKSLSIVISKEAKTVYYLRDRKHVPCFYWVIETRVEVWANEKCCGNTSGNTSRRRMFLASDQTFTSVSI